jgi:hypothetical protein
LLDFASQGAYTIHTMAQHFKYPRTFHLPWSPGTTSDDRLLENCDHFENKEVVATEKLDGENASIYNDYYHARSLEGADHPSRHWFKSFITRFQHEIPAGFRLCAENVFAKHSIHYKALESYFYLFSIWDNQNNCLSWDKTLEWAQLLDIQHVPVLYRGIWDEQKIKSLFTPTKSNGDEMEGYVVRLTSSFHYSNFSRFAAKFVRARHVQTTAHWASQPVIPNKLK